LSPYLSKQLPGYMVPSYVIEVDKIPLTPSGKVDQKALPGPGPVHHHEPGEYTPPSTPLERKLVRLWSRVLKVESLLIGVDSDFFSLGGHSLKATYLVSLIREQLEVTLPLAQVFAHPTIRGQAKLIAASAKTTHAPISPVETMEYYPLSPAQERLYFLQRMDPQNTAYNIPQAMVLEGEPDTDRLEKVFQQLIHRHESLRTSFQSVQEEPVQRVHPYVDFKIELCGRGVPPWSPLNGNHSGINGNHSGSHRGQPLRFQRDFIRPFDLSVAPLLRVGLTKLESEAGKYLFLIDMHHIITDGVSMQVLVNEFTLLYGGGQLPRLPLQYKDFSQWWDRWATGYGKHPHETYWLDRFREEAPVLELPLDYPRPPVQSYAGSRFTFRIGKEETRALNTLALAGNATLFMAVFAIYNVLLSRLSGQEDLVVGTVIAGRSHAGLQQVIGMFVNTLAIRSFPRTGQTFNAFLKETGTELLAAFENQDYPFEDLVEKVAVRRDTSRNPLFTAAIDFHNTAVDTVAVTSQIRQFRLSPFKNKNNKTTAKFDITLHGNETHEGLALAFDYCTRLFKEETVKRFARYFRNIVSAVVKDPGQKPLHMEIIPEEEKKQVLYDFNDTAAPYPSDKTVHQLIEEQVEKTPDGVAVVGHGGNLTYGELSHQSGWLAELLKEKGVQTGGLVAIMAEQCIEMVIGILGILYAGAAYLPIDPGCPEARVDFMLRDSGVNVSVSGLNGLMVRRLNGSNEPTNKPTNPQTIKPTNLAYVIYTSGTTGVPRGVMIEHRSLVNLVTWHNASFSVTSTDRAVKYAGFGFDASVWEIFPYLVVGASLYIVPEAIRLDIPRLTRYFELNGITIGFLPTQVCEQFMETGGSPSSLRVLLPGGDRLKRHTPKTYRLINNYGPTENTVVTTSFQVKDDSTVIPIGGPISNNQIYILDPHRRIQPAGIPGELCIAGDSLARGYLNQPELTKEKFEVKQHFALYHTGDLARWSGDGTIEFLGRNDQQVKIRGNRVELGEIETCLLRHEKVDQAAVIIDEDVTGVSFMTACLVPCDGCDVDVSPLREFLAQTLPGYMVPAHFVQLPRLPLNASGKLDRRALKKMGVKLIAASAGDRFLAPQTGMEKKIGEIWKDLLGIQQVGLHDNFFDLGGNSLTLMKVAHRLKALLGKEIPIAKLFQYPSIDTLSRFLDPVEEDSPPGDIKARRAGMITEARKSRARRKNKRQSLDKNGKAG
ncbi:MAG: amino acid adenylation domain-containing protein, partial [bacterium]|nr:amino acid adenylation domain-containing protein [bacterium]